MRACGYSDYVSPRFAEYLGLVNQVCVSESAHFLIATDPRTSYSPQDYKVLATMLRRDMCGVASTHLCATPDGQLGCVEPDWCRRSASHAPSSADGCSGSSADVFAVRPGARSPGLLDLSSCESVQCADCHPPDVLPLPPCLRPRPLASRPPSALIHEVKAPKRVRFSFAVSFWFPAADQICFVVDQQRALPVAQGSALSLGFNSFCQPEFSPVGVSIGLEHVGFRSPVNYSDGSAASSVAAADPEATFAAPTGSVVEHVPVPAESTSVRSTPQDVDDIASSACGSTSSSAWQLGHIPRVRSRSPRAVDIPANFGSTCVPAGSGEARPFRYTVFDTVFGVSYRVRPEHWTAADCLADAEQHSTVPNAFGRVLRSPHYGFPTPQVLVSDRLFLRTHRAFVLSLQSKPGAEVLELPRGQSAVEALALSARADGWEILVSCVVDGGEFPCRNALPAVTDTLFLRVSFPMRNEQGRLVLVPSGPSSQHLHRPARRATRQRPAGRFALPSRSVSGPEADEQAMMQLPGSPCAQPGCADRAVAAPVSGAPSADNAEAVPPCPDVSVAPAEGASALASPAPADAPFVCAADADTPVPFTVFDEVFDFRTFSGQAGWEIHDFISFALSDCGLAGRPAARVLSYEVVSLPTPQTVLTQDRGPETWDSFILDLRPFGGLVVTLDVPCGTTLADAIQLLATAHYDVAAARASDAIIGGLCAVHFDGVLVNAMHPLPSGAGVIQFFNLQLAEAASTAAAVGACHDVPALSTSDPCPVAFEYGLPAGTGAAQASSARPSHKPRPVLLPVARLLFLPDPLLCLSGRVGLCFPGMMLVSVPACAPLLGSPPCLLSLTPPAKSLGGSNNRAGVIRTVCMIHCKTPGLLHRKRMSCLSPLPVITYRRYCYTRPLCSLHISLWLLFSMATE